MLLIRDLKCNASDLAMPDIAMLGIKCTQETYPPQKLLLQLLFLRQLMPPICTRIPMMLE